MKDHLTEPHIRIHDDRTIVVPKELRKIAVQFDHNAETVTFDCPRYWDNVDMSTMTIYINYMRKDGARGQFLAKNVVVDAADNKVMHFDWKLSQNATLVKGPLIFLVCIKNTGANGEELFHWNSERCSDVFVSEGLECDDVIGAIHADIITDLLVRMDKILVANSPILDTTLTERGLAADAKITGDAIRKLTADKTDQVDFIQEVAERKQGWNILAARMDEFSVLGDDATSGDAELADIRVDVNGKNHPNAGSAVRAQVTALHDIHKEQKLRLDCGSVRAMRVTGDDIQFNRVGDTMLFWCREEADVWTCNGNYFPTISTHIGTYTNFHSIDIRKEDIEVTTLAGKTYQNIRTKPIFLKAGTYVFHRKYDILDGNVIPYEVNSIGFCYISTCTKDGTTIKTNAYSIQGIEMQKTITFDEDVYVLMNIYSNMNANLDYDLTIRFYDFSITKEDFDVYIPYKGCDICGADGVIEGFDEIRVYSDKSITIDYTELLGMSYEDIHHAVTTRILNDSDTVVCWGDSLTNGAGSKVGKPATDTNEDASYPAALGRLLLDGKTVLNGGVGGESSWMIAARQGGESIMIEPVDIPAECVPVKVTLKGQESNYFYDNTIGKWTYIEGNLSYNISVDKTSLVNPCYIDDIEGSLTRRSTDNGYEYYFTRTSAGAKRSTHVPRQLITNGYSALRDAINVIWIGQNDAPNHNGAYILQGIDRNRAQCMIDILNHKKYIVMDMPSGDNASRAQDTQAFNQQFGAHYLNIREYVAKYGVDIANSLGANITVSDSDRELINSGKVPSCLRSDNVHGNY